MGTLGDVWTLIQVSFGTLITHLYCLPTQYLPVTVPNTFNNISHINEIRHKVYH